MMLDLNQTADLIGVVKKAIVVDAYSGRVPWTVPDFSALHGYVDANTYLIDAGLVYDPQDQFTADAINLVEDAVAAWLKLGRLADLQPVRVTWSTTDDYELTMSRQDWRDTLGIEPGTPMTVDSIPVGYLAETEGTHLCTGTSDRVVTGVRPLASAHHDPDDVADLVAHDAAAGLPGFTPAPERNTGAWAWSVINALTGEQRQAAADVAEMVALALAHRMQDRPATHWVPLARTVIAALVDSVHGPGVAHEADTLLTWWRDLADERRAATGVDLPGTVQAPAGPRTTPPA